MRPVPKGGSSPPLAAEPASSENWATSLSQLSPFFRRLYSSSIFLRAVSESARAAPGFMRIIRWATLISPCAVRRSFTLMRW